jgi:voltage-gated sodium channel
MRKLIYNDNIILFFILTNVGIIYLHTFSIFAAFSIYFDLFDILFTLFFSIEIIVKISDIKAKNKLKFFLKDHWHKIDFFSILLTIPSIGILLIHDLEIFVGFTALRSLRVFKLLRIIEYIPNGKEISKQMFKAFKSIAFIIFSFLIYSTIISLISVSLFKSSSPSYFQNAFDAFFTIFKIFSGDGFSDVVSEIERNSSKEFVYFTKIYFVFIVFTGSILGLSLINSIFINQMLQIEEQIVDNEKNILKKFLVEIEDLKKNNEALVQEVKNLTSKKEDK